MKLPDYVVNLWKSRKVTTTERTTLEEQKEIVDRAERFDKLIEHPGWEDVCRYMVAEVQSSIAAATKEQDLSTKQQALVIRWDAKRELLDNTLGYVESIRKSRDDLIEAYKQYEPNH